MICLYLGKSGPSIQPTFRSLYSIFYEAGTDVERVHSQPRHRLVLVKAVQHHFLTPKTGFKIMSSKFSYV